MGKIWCRVGGGVSADARHEKKFEKVFYSEKKGAMCKKRERRWKI